MAALGPTDLLFLTLEKPQQPMHVGGLFLFEFPEGASDNYVYEFARKMRHADLPVVEPYNQVLKGLFWEEDDDFELAQHFRHVSLTRPGRIRELLMYVSQEHSVLIDRAKPLWECHIIEGIEPSEGGKRRFATYFKIHHGLIDGIAGMRLLQKSFTPDPNAVLPPIWSVPNKKKKVLSVDKLAIEKSKKPKRDLAETLKNQIKSIPVVAKELFKSISEAKNNPDYVSVFQAPQSVLNQKVSATRRFAAQSYDLHRLQAIAKSLHVTLNDLVLAVCSGALRAYLVTSNALPKKPLIAMVPVSLRHDDSNNGNQFAMILANLATHRVDRLTRLQTIVRSVKNAKSRFSRMTQTEIMNYVATVFTPSGINLMTGLFPKHQAFNIVISNVPGPKSTLYWNGAKLDSLYPLSIVLDGQAMNITLTSYESKLEVGITACHKTLPRIQSLLGLLEDEITAFEAILQEREALADKLENAGLSKAKKVTGTTKAAASRTTTSKARASRATATQVQTKETAATTVVTHSKQASS